MFISHLPSAYLISKSAPVRLTPAACFAFLIGSVLPDLDIVYFYLIDARQQHHHDYLTHRPILWLVLCIVALTLRHFRHSRTMAAIGAGVLLHLLLDSICGKIAWLWPLSDWAEPLVVVPATHDFWVMSFLTHWTFKVEVVITLIATISYIRSTKNPAR